MCSYSKLVESFKLNPRDVCTVPLTKKDPLWFYVFSEDDAIWVCRAKSHSNSSSISKSRLLKKAECDAMLDIYHRRQRGEAVSKEAAETTINQVYWYGVFADLEQ